MIIMMMMVVLRVKKLSEGWFLFCLFVLRDFTATSLDLDSRTKKENKKKKKTRTLLILFENNSSREEQPHVFILVCMWKIERRKGNLEFVERKYGVKVQ